MTIDHDIPYGRQTITDADVAAVNEALRSDFLTQGPRIMEFEERFAGYVGSRYGVAVEQRDLRTASCRQGSRGWSRHTRYRHSHDFRSIGQLYPLLRW